ncbi:MAG: glycosyltransferase family 4 protein [Synergistaceae bacterium]|nr:glycosyltransferase family 4 protein [Synergistaceae bacterium]
MKVLHYVDENNLSWARPYVQILRGLDALGCENVVVCRPGGTLAELLKNSGFDVREYKPLISSLPCVDVGFGKILRGVKPDIIHTRLSSAANIAGYWGRKAKIPVLSTIDKFPKKKYYANSTMILPCSTPVADFMNSQGISREKMTVVPNALDVDFYARDLNVRNELRRRENLSDETICFIGVGRFVDWKGFDDLIRSFGEFLAKQQNPEKFCLWLAGDGPERERLAALVNQSNLNERVKFWGFVDDVRPLLWGADVYVHPSWGDEAFGLSLLEAMSSGLAVVASESGGMTEILNDSQGLLFPRRDTATLAKRMEEAIKKADVLKAASLSRAKDFDVKIIAKKTFDVYSEYVLEC